MRRRGICVRRWSWPRGRSRRIGRCISSCWRPFRRRGRLSRGCRMGCTVIRFWRVITNKINLHPKIIHNRNRMYKMNRFIRSRRKKWKKWRSKWGKCRRQIGRWVRLWGNRRRGIMRLRRSCRSIKRIRSVLSWVCRVNANSATPSTRLKYF